HSPGRRNGPDKLRYPWQMWLDGIFMGSPFLAHYGKMFEEPAMFDDVANQIILMDKHAYDPKTGLHYHAWDEKREQPWADKKTGQSPNFWGRAEGWYAMALVDSLDFFSPAHPEVDHINDILRRVAAGIARWQDPKSGLWWQVLNEGDREGNYLEATASTMFVYALAKGINRGYLPRETYLPVVTKGYAGIIRDLIEKEDNGLISLTQCCSVAGLGYTNSRPRARRFVRLLRHRADRGQRPERRGAVHPRRPGSAGTAFHEGIEADRARLGRLRAAARAHPGAGVSRA
ncbi:MAG: glycoside hydrolase family 88/105 protein, partial [Opitutaceae bacterium]